MNRLALAALLIGLLACTDSKLPTPVRKPVTPPAASGWARLPLDREAQRAFPEIWLSDAAGQRMPYLVERDGLWQPRELALERLALGRDGEGRPTAEFVLKYPQGWQVREREQLRIALELEGAAPWVSRVEVARRLAGSSGITVERDIPLHVFDLGDAGRQLSVSVPWDFQIYRLTLHAVQGAAPRLKAVRVTAVTEPSAQAEDALVAPRMQALGDRTWRLSLEGPDRVVGAEIELAPPVAPVAPVFLREVEPRPGERDTQGARERLVSSSGLVWNLPALESAHLRVGLEPLTTDHLLLRLPEGAVPLSVRLRVRRDTLLFPALAGQVVYLHLGGQTLRAPGNLAALPDSSRDLYQRAPLALGPAEPDPHGVALQRKPLEEAKDWLPWITGLAVLALGAVALKLFRR